jgi:hypothetical protein
MEARMGASNFQPSQEWIIRISLAAIVLMPACARLPYTTTVVHESERVVVLLQQEVEPTTYTHPVQLAPAEVAAILGGFSLREKQRLPLRWFAEEAPPKKIFREDELKVLAPHLAEALQRARQTERVYFEVIAPGFNPRYRHDLTAGWIVLHESYLHLQIEYFHAQIPIRKSDLYDYNYPTPLPTPNSYLLYFEPGRFWVPDPASGNRAVDFGGFLKSANAP